MCNTAAPHKRLSCSYDGCEHYEFMQNAMKKHKTSKHNEARFTCICGNAFKSKQKLATHCNEENPRRRDNQPQHKLAPEAAAVAA
jgi:hypothetical protein